MTPEKDSRSWLAPAVFVAAAILILNNFNVERRLARVESDQAKIADIMLAQARVAQMTVTNREDQLAIHEKEFEYLESKIQRLEHAQALMVGAPEGKARWTPDALWQVIEERHRESTNQ